jgi:hypothetical protein
LTEVVEFTEWLCGNAIKTVPLRHLQSVHPKISDKNLFVAFVGNSEGRLVCHGNFITIAKMGVDK